MSAVTEKAPKPFGVYLVGDGALVLGHDNLVQAQADASERNSRAETLGIKARYEARSS